MRGEKWDYRGLSLAVEVSRWSKDPVRKQGASMCSPDSRSWSFGYNGFPPGISDDDERLNGPEKNDLMVHAELNAILNAGCDVEGWRMHVTDFPCLSCAKAIVSKRISYVIVPHGPREGSKWYADHMKALYLFNESSVGLIVCPVTEELPSIAGGLGR